jgi:TPR repeat protein
VPQDYARGFGCYAEAAKRGMPEAQHNVGAMLVSARGVKRDYVEGLAWIILAGKSGADSGAEAKVRARLAHRPADIAAAEARAAVLWDGLKHGHAVAPDAAFPGDELKPVEPTPFQPEPAAPPKVDLAAPKVEIPVAPPPAPPPAKL